MSDEHIKSMISHAQGVVAQVVGTLIRDRPMQRLGTVRHAQGFAQQGLGNVQDMLGGTRNGIKKATIAAALLGGLLLVTVTRVVGGRQMRSSRNLGAAV